MVTGFPAEIRAQYLPYASLEQWSLTWGTQRHLRGYAKTSYIKQKNRLKLEPALDARTHEDSSRNLGAGMPETSSGISIIDQSHISW
jgi:hypothetical protein